MSDKVVNPITGKKITIGKRTYRRLVKSGDIIPGQEERVYVQEEKLSPEPEMEYGEFPVDEIQENLRELELEPEPEPDSDYLSSSSDEEYYELVSDED